MDELSNELKITWVKGLLIDCPVGEALETCPAKDLRIIAITDRMKLVDGMSIVQLDSIISYHKSCIRKREWSR